MRWRHAALVPKNSDVLVVGGLSVRVEDSDQSGEHHATASRAQVPGDSASCLGDRADELVAGTKREQTISRTYDANRAGHHAIPCPDLACVAYLALPGFTWSLTGFT
jgi:hypothetical protein